jgi:hypothetical protein
VSPSGAPAASRVLVVGSDADVCIAFHLHLERAGHALVCLPSPGDLEGVMRIVAPHVVVLLLPAAPDATWGNALTAASSAARVGVRVVVVAPSREVVEPLAAVAGAERALSRTEVLSRPLAVVERTAGATAPAFAAAPAPAPTGTTGSIRTAPPASAAPARPSPPATSLADRTGPLQQPRPPPAMGRAVDLMALIDEELVDEPKARPPVTRVEVNVSLVSEHNFYVGSSRRVDSGGVFIATVMPPPPGTRLQVRLGLADGRKLDLDGEVAFVREKSATSGRQPTGCGVRLFNVPNWAIDAIDRFVLARQPIVYVPA